jgi:hypothetical protein
VDATDAQAYVEASARHLIGELRDLEAIVTAVYDGSDVVDEVGVRRVRDALDQDVGHMTPGELSTLAEDRLLEYPLAVETTTTFEVVLGCGGPTRTLCLECDRWPGTEGSRTTYDVRRVTYPYSWSGSAEVELSGSDREVAESFARRVVPELA